MTNHPIPSNFTSTNLVHIPNTDQTVLEYLTAEYPNHTTRIRDAYFAALVKIDCLFPDTASVFPDSYMLSAYHEFLDTKISELYADSSDAITELEIPPTEYTTAMHFLEYLTDFLDRFSNYPEND